MTYPSGYQPTVEIEPEAPEPTLEELRQRATEYQIEGRSKMDKAELMAAVAQARLNRENAAPPPDPAALEIGIVVDNDGNVVRRPEAQ